MVNQGLNFCWKMYSYLVSGHTSRHVGKKQQCLQDCSIFSYHTKPKLKGLKVNLTFHAQITQTEI